MNQDTNRTSRVHDLLGTVFGVLAAFILISSPWNVDAEGPDPFYKGPLIFPIIALSLLIVASIPCCFRLLRPDKNQTWQLDGEGAPKRTVVVFLMLIGMIIGLNLMGLMASTWLFLTIAIYYLGHRGMIRLVIMPVIMTVLIALVFKQFLDIYFPTPLIVEWIWE